MNMFARLDEMPAMTLQVNNKTKRYGRTDGCTHGRTHNVKTVYPTTNKVCGRYNKIRLVCALNSYSCSQTALRELQEVQYMPVCFATLLIEKDLLISDMNMLNIQIIIIRVLIKVQGHHPH